MPNIDGFRATASTSLQGNVSLDPTSQTGIKNSGTGFMGRVVTWFQNIGKAPTLLAQANRQVMDTFIQTIANEKGQQYADLASALLRGAHDSGQPLKGYMVTSVLNAIDMEVGKVKQFNTELLGRFVTSGDPLSNPNCPEALFPSVISEKDSTIDPKGMLTPDNISRLKGDLSAFIREQAGPNGDKPVTTDAVRQKARELIGGMVDLAESRLTELEQLDALPQERSVLREQILSGSISKTVNVAFTLSMLRVNAYMDAHFDDVMQGAIDERYLPGNSSDYPCSDLKRYIARELSDHPDCQTVGLGEDTIKAYVKEKVDAFMAQKSACFEVINSANVSTEAKAELSKALMGEEFFCHPAQIKGLIGMMPAMKTFRETVEKGVTPEELFDAMMKLNQAFDEQIKLLPTECRGGPTVTAFRLAAGKIGIGSDLSPDSALKIFDALTSPQNLQVMDALDSIRSSPKIAPMAGPTMALIDGLYRSVVSTTGAKAGKTEEQIGMVLDRQSVDVLPDGFGKTLEKLDLYVTGTFPNHGVATGVEVMAHFHKSSQDVLQQNTTLSFGEIARLGTIMDHPSTTKMGYIDHKIFNWLIRGDTSAMLALGEHPTEKQIWETVFHEPMPAEVNATNLAPSMLRHAENRAFEVGLKYLPLVQQNRDNRSGPDVAMGTLGAALDCGLSFIDGLKAMEPHARLSMEQLNCDVTMIGRNSYNAGNAYGQTVDLGRWASPTLMVFKGVDGQTTTLDPNNHPGRANRTGEPTVNDGVVTDVLGRLRALCGGNEEQVRTASMFLTQASTVILRKTATGLGQPLDEHGAYTFNVSAQHDGSLFVSVTTDPSMPTYGSMTARILPDGQCIFESLDVAKKD